MGAAKRADGTIGSQFFITTDTFPFLNEEYTIFGRVSSNTETIDLMNACGSEDGVPIRDVRIKRSGVFKVKGKTNSSAAELKDFNPNIERRG